MGLTDFRYHMRDSRTLEKLVFYPKSRDCFSGVDIAGGVCYFLLNKSHNDICEFITITNSHVDIRERLLDEFDIIIGDNTGVDIIHKVQNESQIFMDSIVLPIAPFGLSTFARGSADPFPGSISVLSSKGKSYIKRNEIAKNRELIDLYKVAIGQLNPDRGGVNNAKDGKSNVITKIKYWLQMRSLLRLI